MQFRMENCHGNQNLSVLWRNLSASSQSPKSDLLLFPQMPKRATTKAGFNNHGLKVIQITGVIIANQIPALLEKTSQAQDKLL
jgi:hypothetical protein